MITTVRPYTPSAPPKTLHRDLSRAIRDGSLDGYREGPLSWGNREMSDLDIKQAFVAICPECGQVGMGCRQFYRADSHRAFVICPACDRFQQEI